MMLYALRLVASAIIMNTLSMYYLANPCPVADHDVMNVDRMRLGISEDSMLHKGSMGLLPHLICHVIFWLKT